MIAAGLVDRSREALPAWDDDPGWIRVGPGTFIHRDNLGPCGSCVAAGRPGLIFEIRRYRVGNDEVGWGRETKVRCPACLPPRPGRTNRDGITTTDEEAYGTLDAVSGECRRLRPGE